MDIKTNFIAGKMNKSVDERLIPPGQYIDALNVRLGSTEGTEIGAVENSKGNTKISTLRYEGVPISDLARCIGAYVDGVNENVYWFVHDPANPVSATGKVDLIVSFNTTTAVLDYHLISVVNLNFNPQYLITGVDLIENLLFWTDDINPPRKININRNYGNPSNLTDGFTSEEINVIVKPPGFSSYTDAFGATIYELPVPAIKLVDVSGDENYIVDKFLCFAYRYQYVDNEYSATSLFTTPAFEPGQFWFDPDNVYNEGMENIYNGVDISFGTGNNQVIAVEVLFKQSGSNTIFVIERFKKSDMGWSDNSVQSIRFTNSKIYSVIGQDELLRWYDNVPRFAKAQTIMGNRLVYGNYIDQYDIVTKNGIDIPIDFSVTAISNTIINASVTAVVSNGAANILNPSATVNVPFDRADFDLSNLGIDLPILINSEFNLQVKMTSSVVQPPPYNVPLGGDVNDPLFPVGFSTNTPSTEFFLETRVVTTANYTTFNAFLLSPELATAIGTGSSLTPISPGAVYGNSLSDELYKQINPPSIPTYQVNYTFVNSGKFSSSPAQQGFRLAVVGSEMRIQAPAVQYQYDDLLGNIVNVYEYFSYSLSSITQVVSPPNEYLSRGLAVDSRFSFTSVSDSSSLHSNRNYDAAIMYMDDYGRSTTALVSTNNTVFFDASTSVDKNTIRAVINNAPPYWASKYKFLLKPSLGDYNIIYSNEIYTSIRQANIAYIRLQGDATALVAKGDVLTVKIESTGFPVNSLIQTTVLDVEALSKGQDPTTTPIVSPLPEGAPAGLYMSVRPQGYIATTNSGSNIDIPFDRAQTTGQYSANPTLEFPVHLIEPDGTVPSPSAIIIPAGSVVSMKFKSKREAGFLCRIGGKKSILIKSSPGNYLVKATQDSTDFRDFWNSENIDPALFMVSTGDVEFTCRYYNIVVNSTTSAPAVVTDELQFYWKQDTSTDPLFLVIRSCQLGCYLNAPPYSPLRVDAQISININNNFMAFETKPLEADPNFFYDSSEMYNILPDVNGSLSHQGDSSPGSQNQIIATRTPAIVNLPFYDVYSFGNGVESYRYRDLASSKDFLLGERQTAVSNNEFKEADRFAGLTYSGVFSGSNNVNNLNEFNLGLVNFKDLELIFGPVMKLHNRETDILVLQEDKISYVLANKQLISDAQGGGPIVTTPVILGTQIARIEEYGISFNPESFVNWGASMYFSDAKRGAVIKLTGSSLKSDELEVISTYGMRSYFRDKFVNQLTSQKLGGFDPYMDEYVFSSNNIGLPVDLRKIPCDTILEKQGTEQEFSFEVELGVGLGDVVIDYTMLTNGSDVNITTKWNNISNTTSNITTSTSITVDKTLSNPQVISITITPNVKSSYQILTNCVITQPINVVSIVLTTPVMGLTTPIAEVHYEYSWDDNIYFSPTTSNLVTGDATNFYSAYSINDCQSSIGSCPANGSFITMQSNKLPGDTYFFDILENKFYVFSDTAPPPSSGDSFDLAKLQPGNTLPLGPITNPQVGLFEAKSSAISITPATKTLYLVWDLRDRGVTNFCYSQVSGTDACNNCPTIIDFWHDGANYEFAYALYQDEELTTPAPDGHYSANGYVREQLNGKLQTLIQC
tara:strand:- start:11884 stop:16680 length:4797 start_codon:yes stop_codon:yes gene_type:complete